MVLIVYEQTPESVLGSGTVNILHSWIRDPLRYELPYLIFFSKKIY